MLCREPHPERNAHVAGAFSWSLSSGERRSLFSRQVSDGGVTVHRLPHGSVRPVYPTDKERAGNVKSFEALTDEELARYHEENVEVVGRVLEALDVDIVHANHLVWQPSVLAALPYPFVVFPHGSAIEYNVRRDARDRTPAREALLTARA